MGERIRQLRESHGYKQQWIADQVGVQLRTYQFWQAGQSPPEQENLEALAKLFGVTPTYILRGETPDLANSSDGLARLEARLAAIEDQLEALKIDTERRDLEVMRRLDAALPPRGESLPRQQQ